MMNYKTGNTRLHFRGLIIRRLRFVLVLCLLLPTILNAQGVWSINSSVQMTQGDFITGNTSTNYYFNFGSRYRAETWYVSATFSLITQDGAFSESTVNNMMDESGASHLNMGFGDIYLFGEIYLLKGTQVLPRVALSSQIKIPTAGSENYFSTGEFDYGIGLTFRKQIFSLIAFGDIGYLNLGDPEDLTFLNPLTFGIGVGKGISNGKYSLSLYYQRYTKIYESFDAPHQISFGLYIKIINRTYLSLISSKGLSETSPDFNISTGLEIYL